MTRIEFRRVVIACGAAADMRRAVGEAAVLAAQWHAELHGVYVEDENLHRLAELDIARHVGFTAGTEVETPLGAMLKEMLPTYGDVMRRALEAAAVQYHLAWSFASQRLLPSASSFQDIEGDILIIDAGGRPFSGNWRPRSAWEATALAAARTVLVKRRQVGGHGTVIVMPRNGAGDERLIAAAFAVAAPGDDIVILSPDPAIHEIADVLAAAYHRRYRLEPVPASIADLVARLGELDPALLVLSTADDAESLNALAAGTRCDLLLVR